LGAGDQRAVKRQGHPAPVTLPHGAKPPQTFIERLGAAPPGRQPAHHVDLEERACAEEIANIVGVESRDARAPVAVAALIGLLRVTLLVRLGKPRVAATSGYRITQRVVRDRKTS
jgi:hypothetical protein